MITTNFNPSVARAQNSRQNNVNFQRKFTEEELKGLVNNKAYIYNDVRVFIGCGVIRAKDGALEQAQNLLKNNADPQKVRWYNKLIELLQNQK